MSYLCSLKCHALAQGCTMDQETDYTIETFISACFFFFFLKEWQTVYCMLLSFVSGLFRQLVPDVHGC